LRTRLKRRKVRRKEGLESRGVFFDREEEKESEIRIDGRKVRRKERRKEGRKCNAIKTSRREEKQYL